MILFLIHTVSFSCMSCFQVYDAAEFPDLVTKYEKLNWRIVSKPGGATMKPDHFYQLYGCALHYL